VRHERRPAGTRLLSRQVYHVVRSRTVGLQGGRDGPDVPQQRCDGGRSAMTKDIFHERAFGEEAQYFRKLDEKLR